MRDAWQPGGKLLCLIVGFVAARAIAAANHCDVDRPIHKPLGQPGAAIETITAHMAQVS